MPKEKATDRIAAYVGISAPETPKYLLTNNFLLEYFDQAENSDRFYDYQWFRDRGTLHSEEDEDSPNQRRLEDYFNRFLYRYLGDEIIHEENGRLKESKHFYFPLIQDMLLESNTTLRHVLFHLQNLDETFRYSQMQDSLANYIFHSSSGINVMWKILFGEEERPIRPRGPRDKEESMEFWKMLRGQERTRMKKLGQALNEDLTTLLTHEYFVRLDFYRKYEYLSVLLTSYVLQYIVVRKGGNACLLCKGSALDGRVNGSIHRACCYNYARLRELFPDLLKKYYVEALEELVGKGMRIKVSAKNREIKIADMSFEEFAAQMSGRKRRSGVAYESFLTCFDLKEGEERDLSIKEFVMFYINLTGSRKGSTLQKMSSVLSSCGKQIDMVYPRTNANQKYFAMSESLAEFYVRLYLAGRKLQYDYLDNFLDHLLNRYHIVLAKTDGSEKYLKEIKPNLPAQEWLKNKKAFMETLERCNCLIKLSDSGFVVTLPEEKGGFKLI